MKQQIQFFLLMGAFLMVACWACTEDDTWDDEYETPATPATPATPSTDGGSTAMVGALNDSVNFTVAFTQEDQATYGRQKETVVTDATNDAYDDFVENSTFSTQVIVDFAGTTATVSGLVDGVTMTQEGAHVVLTSTIAGVEYVLQGETNDGQFKLYSEKKSKITLRGVNITNQSGSALNNQSGKRTFLVISDGTENSLTDATSYNKTEGEDENAALFSEGQLCISGGGGLTVTGNYKHGICSDDYLRFSGAQQLTVKANAGDGIHANDSVIIAGGMLNINATGDGIDVDGGVLVTGGGVNATATGDGAKAIKTNGNVDIEDGKLVLFTSGNGMYDADDQDVKASAGIKADGNITVKGGIILCQSTGSGGKGISTDGVYTQNGGIVKLSTSGKKYVYSSDLDSSPKGVKADGNINISGGFINVVASGNDGIDSNGTLTITGGTVLAWGGTAPEEGIDIVEGKTMSITGDSNILSVEVPKSYNNAKLFFSSSQLSNGSSCTVTAGSSSATAMASSSVSSSMGGGMGGGMGGNITVFHVIISGC